MHCPVLLHLLTFHSHHYLSRSSPHHYYCFNQSYFLLFIHLPFFSTHLLIRTFARSDYYFAYCLQPYCFSEKGHSPDCISHLGRENHVAFRKHYRSGCQCAKMCCWISYDLFLSLYAGLSLGFCRELCCLLSCCHWCFLGLLATSFAY